MKPLLCSLGAVRKREMISNSLNLLIIAAVQQEKRKGEMLKLNETKQKKFKLKIESQDHMEWEVYDVRTRIEEKMSQHLSKLCQ